MDKRRSTVGGRAELASTSRVEEADRSRASLNSSSSCANIKETLGFTNAQVSHSLMPLDFFVLEPNCLFSWSECGLSLRNLSEAKG